MIFVEYAKFTTSFLSILPDIMMFLGFVSHFIYSHRATERILLTFVRTAFSKQINRESAEQQNRIYKDYADFIRI